MFKVTLEVTSEVSRWEYESEDTRSTRYEETKQFFYHAQIAELLPNKEWSDSYWETAQETRELMYKLSDNLQFLQSKGVDNFELPEKVTPKWSETPIGKFGLTKDEYERLSSYFKVENIFNGFGYTPKPVGYVYLHFGIRGLYLEQFGAPGVTTHHKGGWDEFTEMGNTIVCEDPVKLLVGSGLMKLNKVPREWDNRYMPLFNSSELPVETLGDLFKDIKLPS